MRVAQCVVADHEYPEDCERAGDQAAAVATAGTNGKRDAAAPNAAGLLPPLPASPLATYHAGGPVPGPASGNTTAAAAAAAADLPGGGNWGVAAVDDPVQEAEAAGPEDAMGGDNVDMLKLGEDGRSPDVIADEILALKESHRSKEQLLLLYKTCRCLASLFTCSHMFAIAVAVCMSPPMSPVAYCRCRADPPCWLLAP